LKPRTKLNLNIFQLHEKWKKLTIQNLKLLWSLVWFLQNKLSITICVQFASIHVVTTNWIISFYLFIFPTFFAFYKVLMTRSNSFSHAFNLINDKHWKKVVILITYSCNNVKNTHDLTDLWYFQIYLNTFDYLIYWKP
jgi:hypothetical protein